MRNDRGARVLLVDDDEQDYLITSHLLSDVAGASYDLEWIPRAEQAREAISHHRHDVYLIDYNLGPDSGVELIRQAKLSGLTVPMILLTGHDGRDVDLEAMQAGAVDYLCKNDMTGAMLERSIRYAIERRKAHEQLRNERRLLRTLIDNLPDGIFVKDAQGLYLVANPAHAKSLSVSSPDETIGKSDLDLLPKEHAEAHSAHEELVLKSGEPLVNREECVTDASGKRTWFLVTKVPVKDDRGTVTGLVGIRRDITARKATEEKLIHDAFHDSLTDLPNRALFLDRLQIASRRARRNPEYVFSVLFLDLDHFKVVNDSLGHLAGDELLVRLARRLEVCVREYDSVARFGGDEFAILLDGLSDENAVTQVADRIQHSLQEPLNLGGQQIFMSASIGVVLSPRWDEPENVLRNADTAMYRAKAGGRACHRIFDEEMYAKALALMELRHDLRPALEREEFRLQYQPIVSLETNRVVGLEALVRWHRPERGVVSPQDFIPLAEETGQIIALDRWVLQRACRQIKTWQSLGHELFTVSVNFSGKHFRQLDLIRCVDDILAESGADPKRLIIEITESAYIEDPESVNETLSQLKARNLAIHVDDFGVGYSSLNYLRRFPIDAVKIDRSFIQRLDSNAEDREIVRAIVWLAHSLNMKVVAEGLETAQQVEQAKNLGCDHGQGFYFARPMDPEAVPGLFDLPTSSATPVNS